MRFGARGNVSPSWFDSHRTDVAGAAMLIGVLLLIALIAAALRD